MITNNKLFNLSVLLAEMVHNYRISEGVINFESHAGFGRAGIPEGFNIDSPDEIWGLYVKLKVEPQRGSTEPSK